MTPQEQKVMEQALEMVQNKMYAHAEMYLKEALAQEKALQALHDENERLGLYKDVYEQQSNEQVEPVACLVGMKGSAYDSPKTKRAYTYKEQPNNVVAYKLGKACSATTLKNSGDEIDRGLGLLQQLEKEGFGVFDLGAEYTHPPVPTAQSKPLTDEQERRFHGYGRNALPTLERPPAPPMPPKKAANSKADA